MRRSHTMYLYIIVCDVEVAYDVSIYNHLRLSTSHTVFIWQTVWRNEGPFRPSQRNPTISMVYIWTSSWSATTPVHSRLTSFRAYTDRVDLPPGISPGRRGNGDDLPGSPSAVGSWISGRSNTGHSVSSSTSTVANARRMVSVEKVYIRTKFNSYLWFGSGVFVS